MEEMKPELTPKEEKLLAKVQNKLSYCSYCQSYDGGEVVWIFGARMDIEDLLDDCNVPEKSRDNIMAHLRCPFCGFADFDNSHEVGVKTHYELKQEQHVFIAKKKHGVAIEKLEERLRAHPLLVLEDPMAKKILKEIKNRALPTTEVVGEFYRARKVEDAKVYGSEEMKAPSLGLTNEGRFNHAGQSHLYLAEKEATAIEEVQSDSTSQNLIWIQKFLIKDPIANILDLSAEFDDLGEIASTILVALHYSNSLKKKESNFKYWRPDYYLTRFIMDCAKQQGYNGIKYNSARSYSQANIVLFDTDKVVAVGKPWVVISEIRGYLNDDIIDF
jgi:hypothetical protein